MSLINLASERFSFLVALDRSLDDVVLHESNIVLTHISEEICIHSQQQDRHAPHLLLAELVIFLADDRCRIFDSVELMATEL